MFRSVLLWAKEVCFNPKQNTKKDFKYEEFIKKLLIISLVPGILFTIITILTISAFGGQAAGYVTAAIYIPLFLISAVVNPFIAGAIIHFFGKIVFKMIKKDYKKTYNSSAYGMIPSFLFGWIPVIGSFIGAIWSIIVQVYAISNQHGVKPKQALIVVLIPVIIILVIVFAAAGAAIFSIGSLGGSMIPALPI